MHINFGFQFGVWRSPVAYLHGVQVVAGSNPVTPTIVVKEKTPVDNCFTGVLFFKKTI